MQSKIAVIGAGRMGSAMARAFVGAGHPTAVWNRSAAKCEPLAAVGVRVAKEAIDAIASADVVVVSLDAYTSSDRLLRTDAVTRALKGKTLVQTTSGSPALAREAATWSRTHGIDYLDASIMATPDLIGAADTTVLYAGPPAAFERHAAVLRTIGGSAQYVGEDAGHAAALDSALLSIMWGGLFGVLVGAKICAAEGIPLPTYRAFANAIAPALAGWITDLIERIDVRRFAGETSAANIAAHHGAFRHLAELAEIHGIDPALHVGFARRFDAAVQAGRTDEDFAALYDFIGRAK